MPACIHPACIHHEVQPTTCKHTCKPTTAAGVTQGGLVQVHPRRQARAVEPQRLQLLSRGSAAGSCSRVMCSIEALGRSGQPGQQDND